MTRRSPFLWLAATLLGGTPASGADLACPPNPDGGPDELRLVVQSPSELDLGWTGRAHNLPWPTGTALTFCLSGCDAASNPVCDALGPTGVWSINGTSLGPPVPFLSGGVATCTVNRFASAPVTARVNVATGEFAGAVELVAEVFTAPTSHICPQCVGCTGLGGRGTCSGGPNAGQPCVVDGLATVAGDDYILSRSCPPGGLGYSEVARIPLALVPLTTATATLAGPRPCGAPQDDSCNGGTCGATCPPASPDRGGIDQTCCPDGRPCFPTRDGGQIVRAGEAVLPAPPWPDPAYPKSAGGRLVAAFCLPPIGCGIQGLGFCDFPGPGAATLVVRQHWLRRRGAATITPAMTHRGEPALVVACRLGVPGGSCRAAGVSVLRGHRRSRVTAPARSVLDGDGSAQLTLALNRRGRRALRSHGTLSVRVRITIRDPEGHTIVLEETAALGPSGRPSG